MSNRATVHAQAKVNLVLRILAQEKSGYHQLETLFCRIGLRDVVSVSPTSGLSSLKMTGDALPPTGLGPDESNLAWRAAALFREEVGWPIGWQISIEKQIPVGAGLGGGSADAGAVLRCLNALAPTPVSPADLLVFAGRLGADVPFLTQAESPLALGWGRGDRLLVVPPLPSLPCAVHKPSFSIATADAYGWLADARADATGSAPARLLSGSDFGSWDAMAKIAENDFEEVVFQRYHALRAATERARAEGARLALLSGSGSALFAIGSTPERYFETATVCRTSDSVEPVRLD